MRAFFIMNFSQAFSVTQLWMLSLALLLLSACAPSPSTVEETPLAENSIKIQSGLVTDVLAFDGQSPITLINDAGFQIGADDQVWIDDTFVPEIALDQPLADNPTLIEIRRARAITVNYGATELNVMTAAQTVGDVIAMSGLAISDKDRVSPARETLVTPGLHINVQPANRVTVLVDGVEYPISTSQGRVGAILAEANIHLTAMDYAIPHVTELAGDTIQIVRVNETVVTESDPISFETLSQPDPEAPLDTTTVSQAGQLGWRTRQIKVRTENDVEVARELTGEWVTQQPVDRIIGYGTNVVVQTESTPDGPIEYWRKINMYATSYSPSRAGTPVDAPWYGLTRSGEVLVKGLVAVDPSVIPLGTQLYIEGYGFAKASDTGGGIKGKWVDLGYEDHDWVSWRAYVDVYILTPVPPADQIIWVIR